jgi:uncharacterized OB-fold protein
MTGQLDVPRMAGRPIAEGVFTWPSDEPRLIGARCSRCEAITFPVRAGCARCGSTDLQRHLLGDRGTLWTWTTQGFLPKTPFSGNAAIGPDAVPWFVGLVELPGELRVESLLVGVTEESVRIGMPLRFVVVPFRRDDDGAEIVTFAFAPEDTDDEQRSGEVEVARA